MNKFRKIAILSVGIIEMLLFSGVFYGFNSLIPIYKESGVFSQYCENPQNLTNIRCATQDTYFGRSFSTWLIVQAVTSFLLGLSLDKFGIRLIKVIGAFSLMAGFLCFAFTPNVNWLLFAAGSFLTMSAHCLGLSNIALSVIFSGYSNLLVSLFSSLYDASAIVMSVLKFFTDLGAPFWLLCVIHASVGFVIILGSIFYLKDRASQLLSNNSNDENAEESNQDKDEKEEKEEESETSECKYIMSLYKQSVKETFSSLKSCMLSPEYIIQVAYFAIMLFRFTFFLAQMSSHFTYLFPKEQSVIDHLLSVSSTFFLGSILISPVCGILLDKYQKYTIRCLSKNTNIEPRQVYNAINGCFFIPSIVCSASMILALSLMFISNQYSFYLVFASMTVMKSLLFAINASYIFSAFPKEHFGTLIGSVFLMTGFMNLIQQVIIPFASADSHPDVINFVLLEICTVTLGHGLFLKFKR